MHLIMKRHIKEILFQIIPVAIGVYLGFFVSNWAEANKRNTDTNKYLENLTAEMLLNKQKIESVANYHRMLRDSSIYVSIHAKDNLKPAFFQGTRVFPLVQSAFVTGLQTGVVNELSLDQIQTINELYNQQDYYNDFGKTLTTGLLIFDFSNSEAANIKKIASFLGMTMTDVIFQEESLLQQYDQALKILDRL